MKKETKEKVKKFWKENKSDIIFGGFFIAGEVAVAYVWYKAGEARGYKEGYLLGKENETKSMRNFLNSSIIPEQNVKYVVERFNSDNLNEELRGYTYGRFEDVVRESSFFDIANKVADKAAKLAVDDMYDSLKELIRAKKGE